MSTEIDAAREWLVEHGDREQVESATNHEVVEMLDTTYPGGKRGFRANLKEGKLADGPRPMYALVVVVEGDSPEQAWKGVAGLLEGDQATRYVGAPWESIPAGTVEFNTDAIRLGMTIPAEVPELRERGEHAHVVRDLTPAD